MTNISENAITPIPSNPGKRFKVPFLKEKFVDQYAQIPTPTKSLKFLYYKEEMSVFVFFLATTIVFGGLLFVALPNPFNWVLLALLLVGTITFVVAYARLNFTIYFEKDPTLVNQQQDLINKSTEYLTQWLKENYNIKDSKENKNFHLFGEFMVNPGNKFLQIKNKNEQSYLLCQDGEEAFLVEETTGKLMLPVNFLVKPEYFQFDKKQKIKKSYSKRNISSNWDKIVENVSQLEKMELTSEQQYRCDRVLNSLSDIKTIVQELEKLGQLNQQLPELEETLTELFNETIKIREEHHASLTQKITIHRNWLKDAFNEGIRIK